MDATRDFLTFGEFLEHWAEERPDATAFEQGERITTYGELEPLTRRIVSVFQDHGIGKGDRVAWLGKNIDIFYIMFLAASRMGAVMAPIGWRLAPPEVAYILQDTGAKLLVTGEGFEEQAAKAAGGLDQGLAIVSEADMRAAIDGAEPAEFKPSVPGDAVLQLYTSGTTGNPKGAELTNGSLLGLRRPALESGLPWTEYREDDCMLVAMPCAHIGGTGIVIASISNGIRALIQEEFEPGEFLKGIEQGGSHMFIVPAALQMVIHHPNAKNTDFSNVRYLMYGAAPIPLELLREAVKTIPNAGMIQVYGMTETSGSICLLPPEDHSLEGNERMRSAGKAVPGVEIRILDADGNEVPRGEIGEVAIRTKANMRGYWNLPEATEEALRDGWMHTGDAAVMDEDGYVFIQDRIKDMIISGGENVYPAQVESAIYGHPAVAEVAVIGVPDETWGEAVKACVVAKAGETVEPADIIAWTREKLAGFKVPKSVDVIPEMPRNPSGKILRRQLRAPYWEGKERQVN